MWDWIIEAHTIEVNSIGILIKTKEKTDGLTMQEIEALKCTRISFPLNFL